MRVLRYILALWTALLVYTVFSLVLGQNGLYARKHLEAEYARLLQNQESLHYTNREFHNIKNSLIYDQDAISVYARQLGYGREDEKFVRIMGLGIAANTEMSVGQVLYAEAPAFVPDRTIKFISAFFGLMVLAFFLIRDLSIFK
jgi:cell division protein FtsB